MSQFLERDNMNIETPSLAVDVVCYHPVSGKIALIERKYPPLGWAKF